MIFAHTYQWIIDKSPHTGERKNQTRRTANSLTPRYRVGKTYAIQPGRGKPAIGRIRILSSRLHVLEDISDAAREMGVPRTTLNDHVKKLRAIFEDAGLRDYL